MSLLREWLRAHIKTKWLCYVMTVAVIVGCPIVAFQSSEPVFKEEEEEYHWKTSRTLAFYSSDEPKVGAHWTYYTDDEIPRVPHLDEADRLLSHELVLSASRLSDAGERYYLGPLSDVIPHFHGNSRMSSGRVKGKLYRMFVHDLIIENICNERWTGFLADDWTPPLLGDFRLGFAYPRDDDVVEDVDPKAYKSLMTYCAILRSTTGRTNSVAIRFDRWSSDVYAVPPNDGQFQHTNSIFKDEL